MVGIVKRLLLVLCVLVSSFTAYGQTTAFINRVVGYQDGRNDYFLPIDVKSGSFSGTVLVTSVDLFDYLHSTRRLDAAAYKAFASNLLARKQELEIKGAALDERGLFLSGRGMKPYTFRIVRPSLEVDGVLAGGCEQFISHYFGPRLVVVAADPERRSCKEKIKLSGKDFLIQPKYDLTEQNNVILQLFKMEIPTYVDDISGSIKIAYSVL